MSNNEMVSVPREQFGNIIHLLECMQSEIDNLISYAGGTGGFDAHRENIEHLRALLAAPACGHKACQSLGEPHPFCEFVKAGEAHPVPVEPEEPEFAIDDSHMDAYHAERRMRDGCVKAIEAQGLKVKP